MATWGDASPQAHSPPLVVTPASLANLGAHVRDHYRLHFARQLAAGATKPLVVPYSLLGAFLLPLLYLSFPHADRPWLYRARLPLLLFIAAFNVHEAFATSSANFAVGYGIGLLQAWGVLWAATLLLWMRPQFDAERVERRMRRGRTGSRSGSAAAAAVVVMNGSAAGAAANGQAGGDHGSENENGRAVMQTGLALQNGRSLKSTTSAQRDGHAAQNGHSLTALDGTVESSKHHVEAGEASQAIADAPDEDVARSLREGYEYYWQAYPKDAPFSTRFGWSFDLVTSFRGTGWNWCSPVLPTFAKPEKPLSGALVDLTSIPVCTRQGYRRCTTSRDWSLQKLVPIAFWYLALDLLSVVMMKDPYFILGPDFAARTTTDPSSSPSSSSAATAALLLPPFLASLPPPVLVLYRGLVCCAGIIFAIQFIFTSWQVLARSSPLTRRLLGTRAEMWHYPCVYGGFVHGVLDRGMAGFWGAWWHQTFRTAFSAPGAWLARHDGGLVDVRAPGGKALVALAAFAQSGFLHALGSVSCLPPSRPWLPPAFFLLCWLGVLVQAAWCGAALPFLRRQQQQQQQQLPQLKWFLPTRGVRRAGNLLFVLAWLSATHFLFADDLGRAGIWMLEPVPVSPCRALGWGRPGDSWLRWDSFLWPRWWTGRTWWQSGIAV